MQHQKLRMRSSGAESVTVHKRAHPRTLTVQNTVHSGLFLPGAACEPVLGLQLLRDTFRTGNLLRGLDRSRSRVGELTGVAGAAIVEPTVCRDILVGIRDDNDDDNDDDVGSDDDTDEETPETEKKQNAARFEADLAAGTVTLIIMKGTPKSAAAEAGKMLNMFGRFYVVTYSLGKQKGRAVRFVFPGAQGFGSDAKVYWYKVTGAPSHALTSAKLLMASTSFERCYPSAYRLWQRDSARRGPLLDVFKACLSTHISQDYIESEALRKEVGWCAIPIVVWGPQLGPLVPWPSPEVGPDARTSAIRRTAEVNLVEPAPPSPPPWNNRVFYGGTSCSIWHLKLQSIYVHRMFVDRSKTSELRQGYPSYAEIQLGDILCFNEDSNLCVSVLRIQWFKNIDSLLLNDPGSVPAVFPGSEADPRALLTSLIIKDDKGLFLFDVHPLTDVDLAVVAAIRSAEAGGSVHHLPFNQKLIPGRSSGRDSGRTLLGKSSSTYMSWGWYDRNNKAAAEAAAEAEGDTADSSKKRRSAVVSCCECFDCRRIGRGCSLPFRPPQSSPPRGWVCRVSGCNVEMHAQCCGPSQTCGHHSVDEVESACGPYGLEGGCCPCPLCFTNGAGCREGGKGIWGCTGGTVPCCVVDCGRMMHDACARLVTGTDNAWACGHHSQDELQQTEANSKNHCLPVPWPERKRCCFSQPSKKVSFGVSSSSSSSSGSTSTSSSSTSSSSASRT
jgi:hypothetical protein